MDIIIHAPQNIWVSFRVPLWQWLYMCPEIGRFVCLWGSGYTCAPKYRIVSVRVHVPRNTGLFPFVCLWDSGHTCTPKYRSFPPSCPYRAVDMHVPQNVVFFPFRVPMGQWIYMYPETSGFFSPLSRAYWTVDIHVPQNIGFFPFVCLWDSRYTCALKYRGFPFVCLWDSGYTYALKYRGFSLSSAYIP